METTQSQTLKAINQPMVKANEIGVIDNIAILYTSDTHTLLKKKHGIHLIPNRERSLKIIYTVSEERNGKIVKG
jgi:hypothetical protein